MNPSTPRYPIDSTLLLLNEILGDSIENLARRLLVIDNAALEGLLQETAKDLPAADVQMLRDRLEAIVVLPQDGPIAE